MKTTILFGGNGRERLVAVATTQALTEALPDAELWFWDADDRVYAASREAVLGHERPFEVAFRADGALLGPLPQALDRAAAEDRVLVLGLHGGAPENGEFQVLCEQRGIPFTGSGSAASHLAFDKTAAKRFAGLAGVGSPATLTLDEADEALTHYGKLVAKPTQEGSSYGLMFVQSAQDLVAVRRAALREAYVIEPFISGHESTCGVLEQADGALIALPPVEIITASGSFDYESKYLAGSTQEICPARFAPEINVDLQRLAILAHKALSCRGYSRSDFIIGQNGPVYLETNTLPGLTRASLYPKSLKAQGIDFVDFLHGQIELAIKRTVL
ncbi:D-alanine--D-alanine ligase [Asticcacaulis sp. EMRT-3]|uniref:D-alanine--D-alanine ligase family protein n=1 Tax=Asticcacaulis sp. EMRT-3 TaxID=3040349 RepID=UPI0024AF7524|nr:D-alanine--D-alanine ligase [Asticcacaulis sp. EMRT-3]MDI7773766.1 D-alanine--D-alanine ligase [Asticcacaulis sp. EMRT-3]